MNTLNNTSNIIIPRNSDSQNKSQELLNSLKSISDNDIQRIGEEIDLKDGLQKPINNEEDKGDSDNLPKSMKDEGDDGDKGSLDAKNDKQLYLENYRKSWENNIRGICDKSKNIIINKSKEIAVNVDIDKDGGKLIEFKLGHKFYKIFEPQLEKHTDDKYRKHYERDSITKINKDYERFNGINAIMEGNWHNQKLKKYILKKRNESVVFLINIDQIKNLLRNLGKYANLKEESDQIAMLMYLTGLDGMYRLEFDPESGYYNRGILRCFNDDRCITSKHNADFFANILMLNDYRNDE